FTIDGDTVTTTMKSDSVVNGDFTTTVVEETKETVATFAEAEGINQVDLFQAAFDNKFGVAAQANADVNNTTDKAFAFLSEFKASIRTSSEFFALMARFDKELGSNLTSIMADAINSYGAKGIPVALKALNVYGVVGKKGRFVYPYRPVVTAILDNFYLAEAF